MRIKHLLLSVFAALAFMSAAKAENVDMTQHVSSNSSVYTQIFEAAATSYDVSMDWNWINKTGFTLGSFGIIIADEFNNQVGDLFVSANTNISGISTVFSGFDIGQNYTFYLFGSHSGGNGFTVNSLHATATAVPGPEAGAGLAGFAMAAMGVYLIRRRRQYEIAA